MKEDLAAQARYYELGETYFWLASHNDVAIRAISPHLFRLRQAQPGRPLRLLDLGCGPGNTLKRLEAWGITYGFDYSLAALAFARGKGVRRVVSGDSTHLPFRTGEIDCLVALEVFEHFADDRLVLVEAFRILRPGGLLLLTVPAFQLLWRTHDEMYGHHRRYTRKGVVDRVTGSGFTLVDCEFIKCAFFFPLLGLALVDRATRGWRRRDDDFFQVPGWLNTLLRLAIVWESRLRINRHLPFGASILCIGQKPWRANSCGSSSTH